LLKRKDKFLGDWVTLQRTVPMDIKDIKLSFSPPTEGLPKAKPPKAKPSKAKPPTQRSGRDLVQNWGNKKIMKSKVVHSRQSFQLYELKQELRILEEMEEKWKKGKMRLKPDQLTRITNKRQLINRIKDLSS